MCVCVCVCFFFCYVLDAFRHNCRVNFKWFWIVLSSIFRVFRALGRVWALLGALWVPLGRQGVPNQGSGREKLGHLTSLGLPKWIEFGMKFRLDF